jgi:uncharacterized protein (TIGR03083 family)
MEIARLYLDAQRSFIELVEPLGPEGWARPVPCTPGWTVRDVLSHQAGVCDDVINARIEGAGSDPWTAAQVERWRHADTATLIGQWREQAPQMAEILQQFSQARPVFDVVTHEHDIRHALGLPGNRGSEAISMMSRSFVSGSLPCEVTIEFEGGESATVAGELPGETLAVSAITPFELVRSRLGRRTRQQVADYAWSEPPPDDLLDAWFVFGPSANPIHE